MGWVEQCWVTIPHTKHGWGSPTRTCQGVIGQGDIYLPTEAEARGEVRASPAPTPTQAKCDICKAPVELPNELCDDCKDGGVLRPCPFCGGIAEMGENDDGANFIECTSCGASTNLQYSLKDDGRPQLIERWNERVQIAKPAPASTPTPEITCPNCGEKNFYHRGWCDVDDSKALFTEYERLRKLMQRPAPDLEAIALKHFPNVNSEEAPRCFDVKNPHYEACLSALKELMEAMK